MNDQELIVDAALDTYPLVELPAGHVRRIMRQIAMSQRFRLDFLDFVLPAFGALFTAVCLYLFPWLLGQADLASGLKLQVLLKVLRESLSGFSLWPLVAILFVELSGAVIIALGLIAWLDQPATRFKTNVPRYK